MPSEPISFDSLTRVNNTDQIQTLLLKEEPAHWTKLAEDFAKTLAQFPQQGADLLAAIRQARLDPDTLRAIGMNLKTLQNQVPAGFIRLDAAVRASLPPTPTKVQSASEVTKWTPVKIFAAITQDEMDTPLKLDAAQAMIVAGMFAEHLVSSQPQQVVAWYENCLKHNFSNALSFAGLGRELLIGAISVHLKALVARNLRPAERYPFLAREPEPPSGPQHGVTTNIDWPAGDFSTIEGLKTVQEKHKHIGQSALAFNNTLELLILRGLLAADAVAWKLQLAQRLEGCCIHKISLVNAADPMSSLFRPIIALLKDNLAPALFNPLKFPATLTKYRDS